MLTNSYYISNHLDAQIVAVGGSSIQRAERFAEIIPTPVRVYGNYEEVAADPEVEIVYICTLHPQHKAAALVASKHGKPVLCEKPIAMNATDAEEMISYAKQNKTFFMEAMWTRYFPVIHAIRTLVREGKLGEIVSFDASLGYFADPQLMRIGEKSQGASSLLDVGIYPLTMASMALGPCAPLEVQAVANLDPTGKFDTSFAAVLKYPSGLATIQGSFKAPLENTATIVGTKGRIHWQNHWSPTSFSFISNDGTIQHFDQTTNANFALPVSPEHVFNFKNSQGLAYEAVYIQSALERGLTESEHESLEESITIMKTIDKIAKLIGFNNY